MQGQVRALAGLKPPETQASRVWGSHQSQSVLEPNIVMNAAGAIARRPGQHRMEDVAGMEEHFREIIRTTGEDLDREGLVDTPKRAAAAFEYLTKGYSQTVAEVVGRGVFTSDTDEMVVVKNIELYSLCEHHMLPFLGQCHVGYLPDGKILGLSKVARIVDVFARRLQIQEELTRQVATAIQELLGAVGVGVVIEARHLCMMMRGVEKQNSEMTTSCMRGEFRSNGQTRSEFLSLIKD